MQHEANLVLLILLPYFLHIRITKKGRRREGRRGERKRPEDACASDKAVGLHMATALLEAQITSWGDSEGLWEISSPVPVPANKLT